VAGIFAVFCLHAAWSAPDVNESHYLSKARHFWEPEWIEGDFFLDSSDSHRLFYLTAGVVTRLPNLALAAWAGRLATWAAMAWAWGRMSRAFLKCGWLSVLSAALFVFLSENFHMAGEWVVGGFEAKGLAYAFVFLAVEAMVGGRWGWVWCLLGAATALHPLVGGWSGLASAIVFLRDRAPRPGTLAVMPGALLGLGMAAIGVLPVLALQDKSTPEIVVEANRIYVFERLPHHLVIQDFKPWFVVRHALLLAGFLLLCCRQSAGLGDHRLRRLVVTVVVIAALGVVLCIAAEWAPNWAAALLRYYWFRMSDSLLPLGVSLTLVRHALWLVKWKPRAGRVWMTACLLAAMWHVGRSAIERPFSIPPADGPNKVQDHVKWREACEWVARSGEIPPDARFLTPRTAQTFKWYAQRAEVVNWKDVPQDAGRIVEWWGRIQEIHARPVPVEGRRYFDSLAEQGEGRMLAVGSRFDARYLITEASPPLDLERLYSNLKYAVYRLRRPESSALGGEGVVPTAGEPRDSLASRGPPR
jgi:hypothetical protein